MESISMQNIHHLGRQKKLKLSNYFLLINMKIDSQSVHFNGLLTTVSRQKCCDMIYNCVSINSSTYTELQYICLKNIICYSAIRQGI